MANLLKIDRFPPFKVELSQKETWRLLSKVSKRASGCWLWTAGKNEGGYGQASFRGKHWIAHRLFYFLYNDSIDASLYACHKCDTRACVNPNHIFLGTAKDNMKDCFDKGRHTNIFRKGHTPVNTTLDKKLAGRILLYISANPNIGPTEIAKRYKVDRHVVVDIKRGRSYVNLIESFDCD